jgi:hypothetical protein
MDTSFLATLKDLYHLNFAILCLVVGLYGYAIYGTIVITRILRDIQRDVHGGRS